MSYRSGQPTTQGGIYIDHQGLGSQQANNRLGALELQQQLLQQQQQYQQPVQQQHLAGPNRDEIIENLTKKIDCLVDEVYSLSGIVETLMNEQRLTKEKYLTLKSKLNGVSLEQQKEEILRSSAYRAGESQNSNAARYKMQSKREMYKLLQEDTTKPSPSSLGLLYKDSLVSQQILTNRIATLEEEIAQVKQENLEFSNRLLEHTMKSNFPQTANTQITTEQQGANNNNNNNNTSPSKTVFNNYQSIQTMLQRYQEPV